MKRLEQNPTLALEQLVAYATGWVDCKLDRVLQSSHCTGGPLVSSKPAVFGDLENLHVEILLKQLGGEQTGSHTESLS